MNYYERHLGDYAKAAGHLTLLEHGAFTLLLDKYYTDDGPIQAEHVYRLCRARLPDEVAAVDAVLAEFFTLKDGRWHNKRAEEEIAKAQVRISAARKNGKMGGRKPTNKPNGTHLEPTGLGLGTLDLTQVKAHQPNPPCSLRSIAIVLSAIRQPLCGRLPSYPVPLLTLSLSCLRGMGGIATVG